MFPSGIEVTSGGHVTDQAVVGESIVIGAQIKNDGYTSAMDVVVSFDITNSEGIMIYIGNVTTDIAANATVTANLTWVVNTPSFGWFNLTMRAGLLGDTGAGEGNYANNEIIMQFLVNVPNPIIVIDLGGVYDYKAGTDIVVSGTVTNEISGELLGDISAWISLVSASGNVIGANSTTMTTASGSFQSSKYIPLGEEGDYKIRVTVQIGDQTFSKTQDITVSRGFVETPTDWWIYAIIIAIVAAIIIFFSLYLYKYGLGRMVECGECGSLIPEASKRCPKCGVQFEAGTAKCSECAAWIPANSTECPECGAKFVTGPIPEEEDEYMKKMREQYQQFLDGYREQAKEVLGKKFSEAKFSDWWKKQPSYITFEKWLSQEEERRKLGAFACPVCGTLNPRGSKVCHKCGTVFETPQETLKEEAEEEGKPRLRRIVKRPVEKKVLKKAEETTAEEKPPEPSEGEPNQGEEPL
jgi:RNA polymerase subunit RPABC4/transcription elongation factor Spt4